MKYVPNQATNEGWGGRGNDASYSPQAGGEQYTAGIRTGPPPNIHLHKHGKARYTPGTMAAAVGPYSIGQSIERVT